tara:strand:- start:1610 stop:1951 length:342 start_codon:yes stop_codon:yes gene_type:complete
MKKQLVDIVLRDNIISLARILEDMGDTLIVQLLKKNKKDVYEFAEYPEEIPRESISGYYDTDDLEKTGLYIKTEYGYEEVSESDADYDPDETHSSDSEDLSDEELLETQDEGF